MSDKQLNSSQYKPHFFSKTSSTRNCQNLLCLTKRCNEDQVKDKERILNYQYFEKLSLKKFNNNSTFINHSYYEKEKPHERSLKREKSTEDSEFQNIVITNNRQDQFKYVSKNVNDSKQYAIFEQDHRIARCSSHRQLEKPQLNTTERSITNQLELNFRRIQDLQKLRSRLESQIRSLDQNIDKYYLIYNSKLQQLKKIQSQMNQIGEEERLIKKMPSNEDLKGFRKKSFWEEFNGNKFGGNSKKQDSTVPTNHPRAQNNYKKIPSFYEPSNNISFAKKAF